ncbi:condensation domain-containing protein [Nonomuraea rhodomycinica]|uniref:Condensation domain-containing protein n=1 Tax=Nonomuraea rhodomycinica TaxID=1712872 RepID=A0A7Y6M9S5_9ACTN|nr:condensation domain-containing protein [Nonomuraea rhodomycinica]NUW38704.1 hypothetical protein [Nonomuraea rhodomycinica]
MKLIAAPLSLGQLYIFRGIERHPKDQLHNIGVTYNLDHTWRVPDGVTVARILSAFAGLVERNEVLRTTYDGIGNRSRQARQIIHRAPRVELPVLSFIGGDGQGRAAEVAEEYCTRAMDLGEQFSWRAALIVVDGRPSHIALCFHHIGVDLAAISLLREDFQRLLEGRPGPVRPGPREIAEYQGSDRWRRRSERVDRYFSEVWRQSARWEAIPLEGEGASQWMATLKTGLTPGTLQRRASEHGLSISSLLMGVFTRALARAGSLIQPTIQLMSANRFDPALKQAAANLGQFVPVLHRTDPTERLGVHCRRLYRETLIAFRNGCYDIDRVRSLREEAYGGRPDDDPVIYFNYAEGDSRRHADDDLEVARLSWGAVRIAVEPGFYGYVWGGTHVSLILRSFWPRFDRPQVEAVIRDMHAELVRVIVSDQELDA